MLILMTFLVAQHAREEPNSHTKVVSNFAGAVGIFSLGALWQTLSCILIILVEGFSLMYSLFTKMYYLKD